MPVEKSKGMGRGGGRKKAGKWSPKGKSGAPVGWGVHLIPADQLTQGGGCGKCCWGMRWIVSVRFQTTYRRDIP